MCPRIERNARMWIGFAANVPAGEMVVALDVIVPVQERLGLIFCAPELRACRPSDVASIELMDAAPSSLQTVLGFTNGTERRELPLALSLEAGAWQPDAASLEHYLAACRALSHGAP